MKTKPAYVVIDSDARTIKRTTQRWPTLYPGEIVVRLAIEVPGPPFNTVHEVKVEGADEIAVAVLEPAPPEPDDEDGA